MDATQQEAAERVAWAVDRGVNYFDIAPSYGNAQQLLGPALEPHREGVFLACKTEKRDAAGAAEALEDSLRAMRTDRFDLYQLHAMATQEDVEQVFGPGGAIETFVKARESGKVRHLGFSAHSQQAAVAAMDRFNFDSVLFPVNFAAWNAGDFGPRILDEAARRNVARLALKAMAHGKWPEGAERRWKKVWYEPLSDRRPVELALRWTLSQPVTAALPPGEWELFQLAVELAEDFRPITEAETAELMTFADEEPVFEDKGSAG
jgi:predicted aldo/keto reductase-like oxidoreductase